MPWMEWKNQTMQISLASALLEGSAGDDESTPPLYLRNVFKTLFCAADCDSDGSLTAMELLMFLNRRAVGMKLCGNTDAIFNLKKKLHEHAPHDAITELEWERGLEATLRDDERSPVVEWIFMEVQRIASQWEVAQDDEHEGSLIYSHPKLGETRVKPPLLLAMDRFEGLLTNRR